MKVNELQDILKVEGIYCKGFGTIPKYVMQDTELSIVAKAIYAYFCSLAGQGTTVFPGRDTIIYHLQISKDFYYKNFKQLVEQGYITVERAAEFPYNNTYTLVNNPKKLELQKIPYSKDFSQIRYSGLKSYGFGIIPRIVMTDNRLNVKAKAIYAYFCSYAGNASAAFPKKDTILYHLQLSENTYYKYYNQLVSYNYITVIQRKSNSKFDINDYILNENPDIELVIKPNLNLPDNDKPNLNLPDNDKPDLNLPDLNLPDNGRKDNIINNITINNINNNNNQSNQLTDRLIDINSEIQNYHHYKQIISDNIEYEYLSQDRYLDKGMLDEILEILVEAVITKKKTIRVCGEEKPADIVKSVFLKLNSGHIQYVLECLRNNTTKISNIKSYLLTALYNAPKTINAFYTNAAISDMYK